MFVPNSQSNEMTYTIGRCRSTKSSNWTSHNHTPLHNKFSRSHSPRAQITKLHFDSTKGKKNTKNLISNNWQEDRSQNKENENEHTCWGHFNFQKELATDSEARFTLFNEEMQNAGVSYCSHSQNYSGNIITELNLQEFIHISPVLLEVPGVSKNPMDGFREIFITLKKKKKNCSPSFAFHYPVMWWELCLYPKTSRRIPGSGEVCEE